MRLGELERVVGEHGRYRAAAQRVVADGASATDHLERLSQRKTTLGCT